MIEDVQTFVFQIVQTKAAAEMREKKLRVEYESELRELKSKLEASNKLWLRLGDSEKRELTLIFELVAFSLHAAPIKSFHFALQKELQQMLNDAVSQNAQYEAQIGILKNEISSPAAKSHPNRRLAPGL